MKLFIITLLLASALHITQSKPVQHIPEYESYLSRYATIKVSDNIGSGTDPISELANAIKEIAGAWSTFAQAFATVSTTSIQRVVQLGFDHYSETSSVTTLSGMPASEVPSFVQSFTQAYALPNDPKLQLVLLEMPFVQNVTWDGQSLMFSNNATSTARSLMLFKNADPNTQICDIVIVDMDTSFDLAPDLLLVHTQRSILGGIWQTTKDTIQTVPHTLSVNDILVLQEFFEIIGMGKMGQAIGLNVTYPAL